MDKILKIAYAFLGIVLLAANPAMSAPYEYAPKDCDFSITFPEKPFIEKKCDPAKPQASCEEIITYTKNIESSGLNFRVTCRSETPDKLKLFEPADLKKTLEKMVDDEGLKPYAFDSAVLTGNIKSSIAMATGTVGTRDVLYIGQIWMGKTSLLTVEGQMLGPENKKVSDAFGEIMKSVKNKPVAP